jgi:hypothetical protein
MGLGHSYTPTSLLFEGDAPCPLAPDELPEPPALGPVSTLRLAMPMTTTAMKIAHESFGFIFGITVPVLSLNLPTKINTISMSHHTPHPPNVTSCTSPDLTCPL